MIGGSRLRQHVVEFILGSGIVTDGVADATSLNGPWSWTVPDGVAELILDGCGAGQGGCGGGYAAGMISAGGGYGGASGIAIIGQSFRVRPSSPLTITLGAATAGTATGGTSGPSAGGTTTIAGVLQGLTFSLIPGKIIMRGGSANGWQVPQASTTAATMGGNGTAAGSNATDNGVIAYSNYNSMGSCVSWYRQLCYVPGGGGGGATGATVGGNGATIYAFYDGVLALYSDAAYSRAGAGTASGGVSRGGGGEGETSQFGLGGAGGSNSVGGNAIGYGAGGGGGAGGFNGGNGGPGYVRFTYWSAD